MNFASNIIGLTTLATFIAIGVWGQKFGVETNSYAEVPYQKPAGDEASLHYCLAELEAAGDNLLLDKTATPAM